MGPAFSREAAPSTSPLPRLVYIGDVPVEDNIGGSVTLWRLLEGYPAERLLIICPHPSRRAARLPGVHYGGLSPVLARLTRSRFSPIVTPLLVMTARLRARSISREIEAFAPEAVLTVTHDVSWLTAAEVALRRRIPLYLVNHDCWFETISVPLPVRKWMQRQFGAVYAQASRRFCVSGKMAEYYRERYAFHGEVLYPGRARNCPDFAEPPMEQGGRPFTLAYAGGIYDFAAVLAEVAELLAQMNATLVIFSGLPRESAVRSKLAGPAIEWRAFVPPDEFIGTLRRDCDALLVVRERGMGENALLSFPSKIVDYTATGLPILLYAPADSAAATWIHAQPEAGLFVEEGDASGLRQSIRRLAADAQLRKELGQAALARGREDFSHARVSRQFLTALHEDARP